MLHGTNLISGGIAGMCCIEPKTLVINTTTRAVYAWWVVCGVVALLVNDCCAAKHSTQRLQGSAAQYNFNLKLQGCRTELSSTALAIASMRH